MKYTHKLLTGIVLLGSAGLLAASIGTGGEPLVILAHPSWSIVATFENGTKNPIMLYEVAYSATGHPVKLNMVNLPPGGTKQTPLSSHNPTVYLNYLGQNGYINIYRHIDTDAVTSNTQHPKLSSSFKIEGFGEGVKSNQPRISITEK